MKDLLKNFYTRFILINNFLGMIAIAYCLGRIIPEWSEIIGTFYFVMWAYNTAMFITTLFESQDYINRIKKRVLNYEKD